MSETAKSTMPDLHKLSLSEISRHLRAGSLSAVQLLASCQSADRHDAFVTRDDGLSRHLAVAADAALGGKADLGPLLGIPYALKDLYGYPGLPIYAGSARPLPELWQVAGPVVAAIRSQLGVMMGKTHTVCFAFGGVGANTIWPTPRNPWSPELHRAPGGSSSGSGVSVAEGSSLYALGTDTAGSVRIPASVNGLAGYKSSRGLLAMDGIVPLSTTLDSAGLLARTTDDLAYLMDALVPGKGFQLSRDLKGTRLHLVQGAFAEHTDPAITGLLDQALAVLEPAVAAIERGAWPVADAALALFREGSIAGVELAARLDHALPDHWDGLDPLVARRILETRAMPAHEYLRRRYQILGLEQDMNRAMADAGIDYLVLPTVAISAPELPPLLEPQNAEAYSAANLAMLRNTCFANICGMCGLTLPIGLDGHGMPVGLQVLAPGGMDLALIRHGLTIEALLAEAGIWDWRK